MKFDRLPDFDGHDDVRLFPLGQGANAIIAIHSIFRGPAAGGCRVWRYPSLEHAATDALRLSRGMSLKNALAELPMGGGKAVIALPPHGIDRVHLFEMFGRAVESLGGRYMTAEDVGSTVADMAVVASQTSYVAGSSTAGRHNDPSPWTALGVFESIRTAAKIKLESDLKGLNVAVQGAGGVGSNLTRLLVDAGARVFLADVDIARAQQVAEQTGAYLTAPEEIHRVAADIYAPCALGACLNPDTVPELKATIVCGGANNQLHTPEIEMQLAKSQRLYCPDYVVNAGGIVAIHGEAAGWNEATTRSAVEAIGARLGDLLLRSRDHGVLPGVAADQLAHIKIGRPSPAAVAMASA